jgi:hypothetical protein
MTREYIFYELSYNDLKAITGLIPDEKRAYFLEKQEISLAEQKKSFGVLGRIERK